MMKQVAKYTVLGLIFLALLWCIKQFSFPIPYSNDHLILFGFDPDIVRKCCSQGTIHLQNISMIEFLFYLVVVVLYGIGFVFGFTYNEVNIILYYFVFPYSWLWMLDRYFEWHRLKIGGAIFYTIGLVWIVSTQEFVVFCDALFQHSFLFLHKFASIWDYWEASVYICLLLPLMVYAALWELLRRKRKKQDLAS